MVLKLFRDIIWVNFGNSKSIIIIFFPLREPYSLKDILRCTYISLLGSYIFNLFFKSFFYIFPHIFILVLFLLGQKFLSIEITCVMTSKYSGFFLASGGIWWGR